MAFEPIRHTNLVQLTYEAIRKRILLRDFRTGDQIPVEAVATQLGVSRTPVVDALKRLEGEGLIEIRARRGCFVRGLGATDIHEIFAVREAIELFSIRQSIERGIHLELAETLDGLLEPMERCSDDDGFTDYDQFIELDGAFHANIVGSSKNRRIMEVYRNLNVHSHVMRVHYFCKLELPSRVNADHRAIVRATQLGDLAAAEHAISGHLAAIRERAVRNLLEEGGQL